MLRSALLVTFLAGLPGMTLAQSLVVSPGPEAASVTVYRDPHGSGAMDLDWLNGFAMVSETRRVSLPAGESELRFEGVAGGLVPQSAVVEGLGDAVVEQNRDAKLLSPGTLLESSLGRRVHLRRTSRATGKVVEQEAVIRSAGDGVVIQTEAGFEALRCTGLGETLLPPDVPPELPAKPTLSVRVRAERPVEANIRLSYLTSGFDWWANYIATLAPDGNSVALFAWLTLANSDETGFRDASAMAVAGRLNREETERLQPEMLPISLNCWPQQRTHEIPYEHPFPPPPPPPPPPPAPATMVAAERDGEEIVLTGSRVMAEREALGDLKLYRIPIPVTVASNSQKQVALLEQPAVRIQRFYRWRTDPQNEQLEPVAIQQIVRMENREKEGLGLPLPAGQLVLYTEHEGRPFLLGEGRMTDRAVGERVDVRLSESPGIMVEQRQLATDEEYDETEITVTSDLPVPAPVEIEIRDDEGLKILRSSEKLRRRDGSNYWVTTIPANGSRSLKLRYDRLD
ncbi:MAG TPA: hypothetical protein VNJ05_11235 [Sphingomicrobium sp.]|nr:hypothetical protein [Sphingomicrobium sp.]